jgi:hypothetical protein
MIGKKTKYLLLYSIANAADERPLLTKWVDRKLKTPQNYKPRGKRTPSRQRKGAL